MIRDFFASIVRKLGLTDFLWGMLTSDIIMSGIGIFILVTAIIGHLPLVKRIPWLAAYVYAAKVLFLVSLAVLIFLAGFRTSDRRAEAKALREKIEFKNQVIEAQTEDLLFAAQAAEDAAKERDAAAERAKADQDRIKDYADQLKARGENSACILTDDDFPGRVRDGSKR